MDQLTKLYLAFVLLATFQGCTTINFDYPKEESTVIRDTSETYLSRNLEGIRNSNLVGDSGFHLIQDGIEALAIRLILAERAERSIDLQYYLIADDMAGKEFMGTLLRAADRGVRIRILLDDVFTKQYDSGMIAVDSHPNIQIRIFNPFNRGSAGRIVSSLTNFSRINRRMHNKSFTVDNQITVIGGRNIADEYFGVREDQAFDDLDVVGVGPVVSDVSTMFDKYWNHDTAIPLPAIMKELKHPDAELKRVREDFELSSEKIVNPQYKEALSNKILSFIDPDLSIFKWSPYQLIYDSPDKGVKSRSKDTDFITEPLYQSLNSAKKEIQIISPYFVPLRSGVRTLSEIQQRGVQITVLTNSLEANNHLVVHSGYAPSRLPLLQRGVKIYETRADAEVRGSEIVADSETRATLHTKAFVIDRKEIFIGSFNFDPRSANINTELGVIIKNPEMAEYFAKLIDDALPKQTYEVFLNDQNKLRWRTIEDGRQVIYDSEPQTSWGQRLKTSFLGLFPIKGQL